MELVLRVQVLYRILLVLLPELITIKYKHLLVSLAINTHAPRYCSSISISFHVHSVWTLFLKNYKYDKIYFDDILSYEFDFFAIFCWRDGTEFWVSRFWDTIAVFPVVAVRAKTCLGSSADTLNTESFVYRTKQIIYLICFFFCLKQTRQLLLFGWRWTRCLSIRVMRLIDYR